MIHVVKSYMDIDSAEQAQLKRNKVKQQNT